MKSEHGAGVDLARVTWRKSTRSQGNGACVEVAEGIPGAVPVRDSKSPQSPVLVFSSTGWSSFISSVKAGGLEAL
ncbi:DUF397 domain-containing protein [Streptomyces sp. NPDC050560]|uniref:DUF397 domain-containing protein n=1 Tax=Streptomyces sp. NPDC050560 TaxID=3365630 RepID=UPI00378EF930